VYQPKYAQERIRTNCKIRNYSHKLSNSGLPPNAAASVINESLIRGPNSAWG
jgi:hypothetical protein